MRFGVGYGKDFGQQCNMNCTNEIVDRDTSGGFCCVMEDVRMMYVI